MLRSLVTKAPEKDKTKEERKVAKNFFQALDARMEANQPEKKGNRPAEVPDKPKIVTQTSNPQAILAKEDGYCPTRTNQAVHMSADELLAERKRAMAEFEREREKKRLENLERMRLEKEKKGGQNSNKERGNPQRDAGDAMLGKRKDNLQSKPIHGTIGYNPLAPIGDMSQKPKPSQPAPQKTDPAFDPRFQFSLKVAESRPSQPPIVAKPPAYNPLQPAKAVGT